MYKIKDILEVMVNSQPEMMKQIGVSRLVDMINQDTLLNVDQRLNLIFNIGVLANVTDEVQKTLVLLTMATYINSCNGKEVCVASEDFGETSHPHSKMGGGLE